LNQGTLTTIIIVAIALGYGIYITWVAITILRAIYESYIEKVVCKDLKLCMERGCRSIQDLYDIAKTHQAGKSIVLSQLLLIKKNILIGKEDHLVEALNMIDDYITIAKKIRPLQRNTRQAKATH